MIVLAPLALLTLGAAFAPRSAPLAVGAGLWAQAVLLATPDMGTCTQGDAGQLGLALFALPGGVACLSIAIRTEAPRRLALWLLPLTPLVLWTATFALRLATALLIQGQPACGFLQTIDFVPDGDETLYALIWLLTAVVLPVATGVALLRRRPRPAETP